MFVQIACTDDAVIGEPVESNSDVASMAASPGGGEEATVSDSPRRPLLVPPRLASDGMLGPLVTAPIQTPAQAGPLLAGRALPTNQWWTSSLIGPGTGQLWAMPLTVQVVPDRGIDLRVPAVVASPAAVVAALDVPVTLVGLVTKTEVVDYDDFSVRLSMTTSSGDTWTTQVAQGSPALTVELADGPVVIDTNRDDSVPSVIDDSTLALVDIHGRDWTVHVTGTASWEIAGTTAIAVAVGDGPATVTFVPVPDDATPDWPEQAAQLAAGPVVSTTSTLGVDWVAHSVTQSLAWHREAGTDDGVVAVAPHQWIALDPSPPILGTFSTPRGPLRLVAASTLRLSFPLRGLVPGVPGIELDDEVLASIIGPITTADAGVLGAGSYYGSKHLARLATLVELARRVGAPRPDLEASLTEGVIDALTRSGDDDTRWMAYDTTWGGIVLEPAEFGSQDYNDHHFHYGYLVHAAAVVAEIDPTFTDRHAPFVDLLIADFLGDQDDPSFPERRVFNPYLGHSFASGFAGFADGNNQESSSEAINAWWAAARWGLVTGRSDLVDDAVAHLHVEAQAARVYWLGELGDERPAGYDHEVAGIVWGGKIDFATWFDGRPSAVIGIQLLPVNFGSLHRADPAAAQRRFDASMGDLLFPVTSLMDLALAAPQEALARLSDDLAVDDGNTLAFSRYWAASIGEIGPPRADIGVDAPYGAAFGEGDRIVVVAVNPTASVVEVGFHFDGKEIARLTVEPHGSAIVPL